MVSSHCFAERCDSNSEDFKATTRENGERGLRERVLKNKIARLEKELEIRGLAFTHEVGPPECSRAVDHQKLSLAGES